MALDLYAKGAKVWIRHPDIVWEEGEIVEHSGDKLVIKPVEEGGEEQTIVVKTKEDFPPLKNPDILIGENDLTSLSYLHEPAVLYNLEVRFTQHNAIYTYCGIVLVAINPYARLPIYGNDVIQVYNNQNTSSVDPHIYAVAEQAYRQMARDKLNQSVIISGESGAGKTVSAKFSMRYFASVGGAEGDTRIEDKVLATNPVMEALGNAKTTRNDNSSRFGKYIELSFDKHNCIMGALTRTYLLEKTRVVYQAEEERNYHVFYQLCAMRDEPEMEELKLLSCEEFIYTCGGECPVVDDIDDKEEFKAMETALTTVGVKPDVQRVMFRIIAAILHMGNIQYKPKSRSSDDATIASGDPHFPLVASLLGVDKAQLLKWLCNRKIQTGREVMVSPLSTANAIQARDALAKHTYSQLFNWVVAVVNRVLQSSKSYTSFIGVLDIYGFEIFKKNSFEQFCINFANEMLQQQFTQHVFKLEQEEYIAEQIQWSMIDYQDNVPCINLISEVKTGIIAMLDEECKLPRGSDDNWGEKLIKAHTQNAFFKKPKVGRETFFIVHFAACVEYTTSGFMDKNKDSMNEEHLHLLRASEYALVAELFEEKKESAEESKLAAPKGKLQRAGTATASNRKSVRGGGGGGGGGSGKRSVGAQFRDSLYALMETLNSTTPNYIRCIKPNDMKAPFEFDPNRAVEQLRACGVLETIHISSAGYPSRWAYRDFLSRYTLLANKKKLKPSDPRFSTETIVKGLIDDEDKYQFGKNKVFFRAGQVAYLERLRSEKLNLAGIVIQKTVRAFIHRRKYVKIRRMALFVQARLRGKIARQYCQHLRDTRAATIIQSRYRRHAALTNYKKVRASVCTIQRYTRGMFGRKKYRALLENTKAVVLQAHVRGWLQQIKYKRTMRGIVLLQSCWRRRKAKEELRKLKLEARSVGKLKEAQKGMEIKIIQLQQKLDEQTKDYKSLEKTKNQLNEELEKLHQSSSQQATNNQASSAIIQQHQEELARLREALQTAETNLSNAKAANEKLTAEKQEEKNRLTEEINNLKEQVEELSNQPAPAQAPGRAPSGQRPSIAQSTQPATVGAHQSIPAHLAAEPQVDEEMQKKLEQMRIQLEEERRHHQQHLKEHNRLLQRYDNLQEELSIVQQSQPLQRGGSTVSLHEGLSRSPSTTSILKSSDLGVITQDVPTTRPSTLKEQATSGEATASDSTADVPPQRHTPAAESVNADAELVMRLKRRVTELEKERNGLNRKVTELANTLSSQRMDGDGAEAYVISVPEDRVLQRTATQPVVTTRNSQRDNTSISSDDYSVDASSSKRRLMLTSTPSAPRLSSNLPSSSMTPIVRDGAHDELRKKNSNNSLLSSPNLSEMRQQRRLSTFLNSNMQKENEELRRHLTDLRSRIVESAKEQAMDEAELGAVQQLAAELNRLNRENNALRSDLRSRTIALLSKDPSVDITEMIQRDSTLHFSGGSNGNELDTQSQITALKETNAVLQAELDKTNAALEANEGLDKPNDLNMTMDGQGSAIDICMQQEVTRLTSENLDLQEEVERLQSRLQARRGSMDSGELAENATTPLERDEGRSQHTLLSRAVSGVTLDARTPKYQGLLKYEPSDEPRLIKRLILELKPNQMVDKLPSLPATILFMCLRYLDEINDERRVQSLLTTSISGIRKVVKNQPKDVSLKVFWLSNTSSLLTYMKQYSGEKAFLSEDHALAPLCLNNFDLTDYRMVLNDLCIFLYQDIVAVVQQKIQPMIVAGMLEHGIPGMWPSKPMGLRRNKEQGPTFTPSDIVAEFNIIMKHMIDHCLDRDTVDQVFVQVFAVINAYMLNNMLLRKDLCHLSRGPQIRYNLSQLEEWCYERLAVPATAIKQLHPITQAAQLLQINKQSPADVDAIIELCHALNPVQIQKLLTMYTPTNEFEKRVPATVIKAVNAHFKGRSDPSKLMMDINEMLPVSFNFKLIDRDLRDVGLPEDLSLQFIRRM